MSNWAKLRTLNTFSFFETLQDITKRTQQSMDCNVAFILVIFECNSSRC